MHKLLGNVQEPTVALTPYRVHSSAVDSEARVRMEHLCYPVLVGSAIQVVLGGGWDQEHHD